MSRVHVAAFWGTLILGTAAEGPKSCCKSPARCSTQRQLYQYHIQPCARLPGQSWGVPQVFCMEVLPLASIFLQPRVTQPLCQEVNPRRDGQEIVKQVTCNGPCWPGRSQTPASPSGVGIMTVSSSG